MFSVGKKQGLANPGMSVGITRDDATRDGFWMNRLRCSFSWEKLDGNGLVTDLGGTETTLGVPTSLPLNAGVCERTIIDEAVFDDGGLFAKGPDFKICVNGDGGRLYLRDGTTSNTYYTISAGQATGTFSWDGASNIRAGLDDDGNLSNWTYHAVYTDNGRDEYLLDAGLEYAPEWLAIYLNFRMLRAMELMGTNQGEYTTYDKFVGDYFHQNHRDGNVGYRGLI